MSFAAVLHLNVADRQVEPRIKAALAGGFALRRLAVTDEELLGALRLVEASLATGELPVSDLHPERLDTTVAQNRLDGVVAEVAKATGLKSKDVRVSLLRQLQQVRAFANLDGGELETNVGAVGNLIRSGRVELFAK